MSQLKMVDLDLGVLRPGNKGVCEFTADRTQDTNERGKERSILLDACVPLG